MPNVQYMHIKLAKFQLDNFLKMNIRLLMWARWLTPEVADEGSAMSA